jgi:hypothetical protein
MQLHVLRRSFIDAACRAGVMLAALAGRPS